MRTLETTRILEVSDECCDPLLRYRARKERPVSPYGLDIRERSIRQLVVVEGRLLVPQALVDRPGKPLALFAQVSHLFQPAQGVGHPQQQIRREKLLQAYVDPDAVPVVHEALGPPNVSRRPLREPRLVVHPGTNPRRPV